MKSIDGLMSRSDKSLRTSQKKVLQKPVNKKPVTPVKKQVIVNKPEKKIAEKPAEEIFVAPVKSFDFDITSEEISKEEAKIPNNPETTANSKPEKKEKKKVSKVRKIITTILLVIVLGLIGIIVYGMVWGNDLIAKLTGGSSGIFDIFHIISEEHVALKTDANGRTNILVFGTSGYDMAGNEGDGVHDGAALTDSIMIVSVDQETKDIAMVNLPRDLKAGRTCTATGKINEVYWCNNMYDKDEVAGANALSDKMKEILGVDIQYYVHIDWAALVTLVDSLGGIDVVLDEDINDIYYTGAVYQAGVSYHLDGGLALGLARARHGTVGGDFSRGNSQQKILVAIKDKLMEKGVGWTAALGIINSIGDNLRTNISLDEMKSGLWLLGDIDLNNIRQVPLIDYTNGVYYMTTATIDGISYVIPAEGADRYTKLQAYIQEQFTTPVKEEPEEEVVETIENNESTEISE